MAKTIERDVVDNLFPGLWGEVDEFLKTTPHQDNNGHPFSRGLEGIEMPSFPQRTLYAVPYGTSPEDMSVIDEEFNAKLMKVGAKHRIQVRLPSWAYEK